MNPLATLPLVLFVVLLELAVGGAIAMFVLDRTRQAPVGFLRLTAIVDAAAAAFAALIAPALPPEASHLAPYAVVLAIAAAATFLLTLGDWPRFRAAAEAISAGFGLALLVISSAARTGGVSQFDVMSLIALPLGALALGGVDAAMLLGHWYLVAPKLSPRPLQTAALLFLGALIAQAVLLVLAYARGFIATAWEVNAAALLLRILVGIVAPLPIAFAAWWTARMNTQSSTGLLYIALGMVLAGEIMARMLFFVAGVPI
jgi:hypothetical protein